MTAGLLTFSGPLTAAGTILYADGASLGPCTVPYGKVGYLKSITYTESGTARTVTIKDTFTPTASALVSAPTAKAIPIFGPVNSAVAATANINFSSLQLGGAEGIRFNGTLKAVGSADDAGVVVTVTVSFDDPPPSDD